MNREIKFRGKDFETGGWIKGSLTIYPKHYPTITHVEDAEPIPKKTTCVVLPETVGQYTGLCDKSGREIYEDDIISFNDNHFRIIFKNGSFMLMDGNDKAPMCFYYISGSATVIGNVYDNRNLLKRRGEMKKKVYISLPITGYDLDERKVEAESIKAKFIEQGYEAITPFDVCHEEGKPYAYYMGKDIEALLGCNYIYLAYGWKDSKGCCAEKCVADIYGIKRIEIEL